MLFASSTLWLPEQVVSFTALRESCGQRCPPKRRPLALGDLARRTEGLAAPAGDGEAAVYLEWNSALPSLLPLFFIPLLSDTPTLMKGPVKTTLILWHSLVHANIHRRTHPRSIKQMTFMWGLGLHGCEVTAVSSYSELICFSCSVCVCCWPWSFIFGGIHQIFHLWWAIRWNLPAITRVSDKHNLPVCECLCDSEFGCRPDWGKKAPNCIMNEARVL